MKKEKKTFSGDKAWVGRGSIWREPVRYWITAGVSIYHPMRK